MGRRPLIAFAAGAAKQREAIGFCSFAGAGTLRAENRPFGILDPREIKEMTAVVQKTAITGCLAHFDKNGLEQLIVNGKANPKVINTLKFKTVAEGKIRHANYIRILPPY